MEDADDRLCNNINASEVWLPIIDVNFTKLLIVLPRVSKISNTVSKTRSRAI